MQCRYPCLTYSAFGTATAGTARPATTSTATAAGGLTTASALTVLTVGTLSLLASSLGLAGKLDGDLALKDLLARELGDGTLGLSRGRQVDKGVADRAVGARVLGDGNRLAVWRQVSKCHQVGAALHRDLRRLMRTHMTA